MADSQSPVYIQLFSRLDDHLNIEMYEETLERIIQIVEKHRAGHPQARISVLLQFTGAMSEAMSERNNANRLKDRLIELANRGLVEFGYDGTEEPTWRTRPRPNFRSAYGPVERWIARVEPAGWFLSDYKEIRKGIPDASRPGALKRTIQVFGRLTSISGFSEELGGDPEFSHHIRTYAANAVLPGLPESSTYPARDLNGYSGAVVEIGKLVSPAPDFASELFWQDDFLRLSDTSGQPVRIISAQEGPEALRTMVEKLDRSKIHIIRIQLGSAAIHLRPEFEKSLVSSTVRYAYDNPKPARLPADAFRPQNEIDAGYEREEAVIRLLEESYFPANPGSQFVSPGDLMKMASGKSGKSVSRQVLAKAADNLLTQWQESGNHPPSYAVADGEYFSLADMFQMLSTALGQLSRSGSAPDSVVLLPILGPIDMPETQGPSQGSIRVESLKKVCADLMQGWAPKEWTALPQNVVPGWITVEGLRLNSAQFLRLMAEVYVSKKPESEFKVRTCQMASIVGLTFPSSRLRADTGTVWTIKPARLGPPPKE